MMQWCGILDQLARYLNSEERRRDIFKMEMKDVDFERFYVMALAGEVGEYWEALMPAILMTIAAGKLSNTVKKDWREGFSRERRQAVRSEIGDILAYVLMEIDENGWTPSEILQEVADKCSKFAVDRGGTPFKP